MDVSVSIFYNILNNAINIVIIPTIPLICSLLGHLSYFRNGAIDIYSRATIVFSVFSALISVLIGTLIGNKTFSTNRALIDLLICEPSMLGETTVILRSNSLYITLILILFVSIDFIAFIQSIKLNSITLNTPNVQNLDKKKDHPKTATL